LLTRLQISFSVKAPALLPLNAMLAVVVSVLASACHKSVFYWNG